MRKSVILIISLAVLLLIAGCGKKGLPMPEKLSLPGGMRDLSGEGRGGVLFLSFSIPARDSMGAELRDLGGFRILKSCGSCMGAFEPFKDIRLDEGQGYTIVNNRIYLYDDDLRAGFRYSYRVYPMTKLGTTGEASNVFSLTWQTPPGRPVNISAKGDDEQVELNWTREDNLVYNVYRVKENVYPLFPVNPGPLSTPLFLDTGLENGKAYEYEIRAAMVKDGMMFEGEGTRVKVITVDRTPPKAPQGIKVEKKGRGALIAWKMNSEKDLLGYNVYRIGGGMPVKLNGEPVRELQFYDGKVPADARYTSYYVTALDTSNNESEHSKEAIILLMKE